MEIGLRFKDTGSWSVGANNNKGIDNQVAVNESFTVMMVILGVLIFFLFLPTVILALTFSYIFYVMYKDEESGFMSKIYKCFGVVLVYAGFTVLMTRALEINSGYIFEYLSFSKNPKALFNSYMKLYEKIVLVLPVLGFALFYMKKPELDVPARLLNQSSLALVGPVGLFYDFAGTGKFGYIFAPLLTGLALFGFFTMGLFSLVNEPFSEYEFILRVLFLSSLILSLNTGYLFLKILSNNLSFGSVHKAFQIVDIGQIGRKKLSLTWRDINHHIHILGQPGSGKSVLLRSFYSSLIRNNMGLLMIDLKADAEVLSEITGEVTAVGRACDLQIIDLTKPKLSVGYNPLLLGGATELKDKFMQSFEWSEEYYKKVSESAILTVMRGLVVVRDDLKLTPSVVDLLEALTNPISTEILADQIGERNLEVKKDLRTLAKNLKDKEHFKALSGFRVDLEVMVKSEFGEILNDERSINLYESVTQNKIIYLLLDSQTYGVSAQRLSRMILADLRAVSGRLVSYVEKEKRPKFTVIIDEFSDIVSNLSLGEVFTGFLNKCRGSGIGVIIAHQSLGDFKDDKLKTQILDSTETIFSFIQKDPSTIDLLSSLAGTGLKEEKTYQITNQGVLFGDTNTGMGSKKYVHEYLIHPNEFKNLNVGECIYIAKKPSRHGKVRVDNRKVSEMKPSEEFFKKMKQNISKASKALGLSEIKIFESNEKEVGNGEIKMPKGWSQPQKVDRSRRSKIPPDFQI